MFQSDQIIKPSTQSKVNKHKSTPQITFDFFPSLIKLEEAFHLKILDKDNINSLVLKYAKLVEYYDFIKDPIKNYFLEKMQFVLSRPESIKTMVEVQDNKMDKIKLMQAFNNFQNLSRAPSLMDIVEQRNVLKNLDGHKNPNQRGQQVNLNLEIQKQKKERKGSLDRIINDFETEQQKMDKFYQEEMKIQAQYFQEKLNKRQRKLKSGNNPDKICKTQASDDEKKTSIKLL